ncbi:hypothetical protein GCM10022254_40680 [Actinomadura meridiana]|uniref:Uncharacterized protein n=1 Tax=Actinomadura meridiana TaxID=559626 RepID=A0ABP8C7U5_9ACTN
MQCPTCGNDTPGTLGKCSHCEAPIDVYSAAPILSAPPPPTGTVDAFEDRTMRVPPPAPSWAPETPPPVTPDLAMPPRPQPPSQQPPLPPQSQSQSPQQTAPEPLRLSPEPVDAPTPPAMPMPPAAPPTPPTLQPSTSFDLEDTASWTFNPDEDDPSGGFSAPPASAWSGAQPALPAPGPVSPAPSSFGLEPLPERQESIVPDSWFAQPRKPDVQDADATQIAGPMGFGGDPDHTRMDPGAGMGAPPHLGGPPMGHQPPMGPQPPMGQGPMGPGPMDQGPMGQGLVPMGQGSTGLMPMGPGGPGDSAFGGGYPPPDQGRGGPNKPLLAAVAALVTIAVGSIVFVAWPSGDDSSGGTDPDPTTSNQQVAQKNPIPEETKQQATALNALLNDSVDTRRILAGALGRAGKCKTLPQAIQGFQTVAQRRQNQLNRTKNLKMDKLGKNGERLRASLGQALTASLQVDQVLLQWAQQNQQNCHGKPRPSAAQVPGRAAGERRATAAKKRFVVLWNPVAKDTEQPQRSWKRV